MKSRSVGTKVERIRAVEDEIMAKELAMRKMACAIETQPKTSVEDANGPFWRVRGAE